MSMKGKEGSREDRMQARLTRMVMKIAILETENDLLKADIVDIHERYDVIIGKMHRMYCLPSKADEIMVDILENLESIGKNRNGN